MKKKIVGIGIAVIAALAVLLFGILQIVKSKMYQDTGNVLGVSWYNETDTEFVITTVDELYELARLSDFYSFEKQTIKLGADIVVNEGNAKDWKESAPKKTWKPIRGFAGTFDGQGHVISGIYGKGFETPMALFIHTDADCSITNLKLVNSYFTTSGNSGTASFVSNGGGKFTQLYSDAIISCKGENAAGIASTIHAQAALEECWYDGDISITGRDCGGLIDEILESRVSIKHCLFSGNIDSSYEFSGTRIGGMVGRADEKSTVVVADSLSCGTMSAKQNVYTGSLFGATYSGVTINITDTFTSQATYQTTIGANGNKATFNGVALDIQHKSLVGEEAFSWTTLNFDKHWTIVDDDTPILQHFADEVLSVEGLAKAFDTSWFRLGNTEHTITTVEQLYGFMFLSANNDFEGHTIRLGADIVINDGSATLWNKESPSNMWYPIKTFSGTFDGQGHTISGLYLKTANIETGLFSKTTASATIKNLSLKNSYLENTATGGVMMGSIVGRGGGNIESVYSNAIIYSTAMQIGGIMGQINLTDHTTSLSNCWFDGEIHLTNETGRWGGGIVGTVVLGTTNVSNCLFTGSIDCNHKSASNTGGMVGGIMNEGTVVNISDCLSAGTIKAVSTNATGSTVGSVASILNVSNTYATEETYQRKGIPIGVSYVNATTGKVTGGVFSLPKEFLLGIGGYQWTLLDFNQYWSTVKEDTPVLKTFATNTQSVAKLTKKFDISWYKEDAKSYTIDSVEDLYGFSMMAQVTDFAKKTVKLGKDIEINQGNASDWKDNRPELAWLPIGRSKAFAGIFDGQGHTIRGLYLKTEKTATGLFAKTTELAVIKNLSLKNSYLENTATEGVMMGSIVGRGGGTIESVYSDATIYSSAMQIGGIIGQINLDNQTSYVSDCWFDGDIHLTNETGRWGGGIVGTVVLGTANVSNCLFTGSIDCNHKSASNTGGMVGGIMNVGTVVNISDCLSAGTITAVSTNATGSTVGSVASILNVSNTYATEETYQRKGIPIGVSYVNATTGKVTGGVFSFPTEFLVGNGGYQWTLLNFKDYWATVKDDTPVLKTFATETLSVDKLTKKVDISWYKEDAKSYTIDSAEDLYGFYMMSNVTDFAKKTVKLGKDIEINKGNAADWQNSRPESEWLPIGRINAFSGTFDGQGHTISGIYIDTGDQFIGLFGKTTEDCVIKNFSLTNSYICTSHEYAQVGSIVGLGYGTLEKIYSDAVIYATGSHNGGLVGRMAKKDVSSTISNCWFDGELHSGGRYQGGMIGTIDQSSVTIEHCLNTGVLYNSWTTTKYPHIGGFCGYVCTKGMIFIEDCLNVGAIDTEIADTANNTVGSILGRIQDGAAGVIRDTYATKESYKRTISTNSSKPTGAAVIIPSVYLAGASAYRMTQLDFDSYWSAMQGETPQLTWAATGRVMDVSDEIPAHISWYDAKEITYEIETEEELYGLAQLAFTTNFAGKTIILKKNLEINSGDDAKTWNSKNAPDYAWVPIGSESIPFAGTFDGDMHRISGLYTNNTINYTGLFGRTAAGSTVKNLILNNSYFETNTYQVGSIVGQGQGTFDRIYSDAIVVSSKTYAGGLIGRMEGDGTITNCWFAGKLTTSGRYAGGIVGTVGDANVLANVTMSHCLNTGDIVSTYNANWAGVGGLCGYVNGGSETNFVMEDSLNVGTITVNHAEGVGSVIGRARSTAQISDTYTTNQIAHEDGQTAIKSEHTVDGVGNYSTNGNSVTGKADIVDEAKELTGAAAARNTRLDFYVKDTYEEGLWVVTESGTPELRDFAKSFAEGTNLPLTGLVVKYDTTWDGAGTEDNPYIISSAEELYGLSELSATNSYANTYFKVTQKIKLNEGSAEDWEKGSEIPLNEWIPIGRTTAFAGIFNGGGNTISGLYIDTDEQFAGLFGCATSAANIHNLRIENSYINTTHGDSQSGSVCGLTGGTYQKIYSNAILNCTGNNNGGMFGLVNADTTISNCWFAGKISNTKKYTGGMVGSVGSNDYRDVDFTMTNCLNSGTVKSTYSGGWAAVGGMVGFVQATTSNLFKMEDCLNTGAVTVNHAEAVGSVVGRIRTPAQLIDVYTTNEIAHQDGKTAIQTQSTVDGVGNYSTNSNTVTGKADIVGKTTILGGDAETVLSGLDFKTSWMSVDMAFPVIKLD